MFEYLPNEMLCEILSQLSRLDLARLAQTCTTLRDAVQIFMMPFLRDFRSKALPRGGCCCCCACLARDEPFIGLAGKRITRIVGNFAPLWWSKYYFGNCYIPFNSKARYIYDFRINYCSRNTKLHFAFTKWFYNQPGPIVSNFDNDSYWYVLCDGVDLLSNNDFVGILLDQRHINNNNIRIIVDQAQHNVTFETRSCVKTMPIIECLQTCDLKLILAIKDDTLVDKPYTFRHDSEPILKHDTNAHYDVELVGFAVDVPHEYAEITSRSFRQALPQQNFSDSEYEDCNSSFSSSGEEEE